MSLCVSAGDSGESGKEPHNLRESYLQPILTQRLRRIIHRKVGSVVEAALAAQRSPMSKDSDAIVIGAGAAGITASIKLARTGLAVTILEARDRIGGRIFTLLDPECKAPVEFGAEFIHGRST